MKTLDNTFLKNYNNSIIINYTIMKTKEQKRAKQKEWEIKNKEKRKVYMRLLRIKNRKHIYKVHEEWLRRTGKKYYISKGKLQEGLYGNCGLGRKYEKIALKLLKGAVDCNKNNFKGNYDIFWNGLKIDVKMRNLNARKFWGFSTYKNINVDYYLLFCVKNERIIKILFIPSNIFKAGIGIHFKSKYDKYIVHLKF